MIKRTLSQIRDITDREERIHNIAGTASPTKKTSEIKIKVNLVKKDDKKAIG